MTPEEQQQLLEDIRKDNKHFGVLFDQYYPDIFGYIFRRLADYDLARDIAAETFLKAMLKIRSYTWKGIPIQFWLYRIATNEVNQHLRKRSLLPGSSLLDRAALDTLRSADDAADRKSLEQELEDHRDFLMIREQLARLPVKYQEVIALRFFEDKSIREIAAILEVKEGTVKSLLSRGLEQIRVALGQTAPKAPPGISIIR